MDLSLNYTIASTYHSKSQIARVVTEFWISKNMYCPQCGNLHIEHCKNNLKFKDFFCKYCGNTYELKSKNGKITKKISGGSYYTMINKIINKQAPDLLIMSYSKKDQMVQKLVLIPKQFLLPDIIEKRNPLSSTAKRHGWIGANILFDKIPRHGQIYIINNGIPSNKNDIIKSLKLSRTLYSNNNINQRWISDILNCIDTIQDTKFTLKELYNFENNIRKNHQDNNNIKAKIRQTLQTLRDRGLIEFLGHGIYQKISI